MGALLRHAPVLTWLALAPSVHGMAVCPKSGVAVACSGCRRGIVHGQTGLPPSGGTGVCARMHAGLDYLHLEGIMHCDLKPANVLLKSTASNSRGFTCKLCDFGMSRLLDVRQTTHVSTLTYGVSPVNNLAVRTCSWGPSRPPAELADAGRVSSLTKGQARPVHSVGLGGSIACMRADNTLHATGAAGGRQVRPLGRRLLLRHHHVGVLHGAGGGQCAWWLTAHAPVQCMLLWPSSSAIA